VYDRRKGLEWKEVVWRGKEGTNQFGARDYFGLALR